MIQPQDKLMQQATDAAKRLGAPFHFYFFTVPSLIPCRNLKPLECLFCG